LKALQLLTIYHPKKRTYYYWKWTKQIKALCF